MIISIILVLIALVGNWLVYKKMGREGWEAIIPFYNQYVLFETLYGNGWKFLTLLIPLYNIYVGIKLNIDLAHAFNQSTGFGIGLVFLPFIFLLILAFGNAEYGDGSHANKSDDFISKAVDSISGPKRVCSNCGKEMAGNADFCPSCGTKYVEPPKRICPNCGKTLGAEEEFCMSCGTKYVEPVVKVCPNCGAELEEGHLFCAKCGTKIEEEVVAEPEPEPAPTSKTCKACGNVNPLDSVFCSVCGQKLD